MTKKPRYYVIIPAAGIGHRFKDPLDANSSVSKQYITLQDKTILEHTISKFVYHPLIEKIIVVINSQDKIWDELRLNAYFDKLITVTGGKDRCLSVFNGLTTLSKFVEPYDWILVHDAVRPCLHSSDINKLIQEVGEHPVGGILGTKVRDTLKQINQQQQIVNTMERDNIWQALTPQMFRFNLLDQALRKVIANKKTVTDEAAAIESLGLVPMIVEGRKDNIKITYPEDLLLAEKYLN